MTMKEKAESILGGFLERNKEYAVELYINNAVANSNIEKFLLHQIGYTAQMIKNSH